MTHVSSVFSGKPQTPIIIYMDTDAQKLFRNYEEMEVIYQRRYAAALAGTPYIVKLQRNNQLLTFFGSRHTNEITDPQNRAIEHEWRTFVSNPNHKKIALCEGGLRPLTSSRDEAISNYSESGLLTWLATQDAIRLISPEPDETSEISGLVSQHFRISEIVTYYFGRQILQWLKADQINHPDWKAYITRYMDFYAQLKPLQGTDMSLPEILKMFQEVTGKTFDEYDEKLLYEISAPSSNAISAASNIYRDISLFDAISTAWADGSDIFAVYGSGHAIVLEPALQSLDK